MPGPQTVTEADQAAAAASTSLKATVIGGASLSLGGLTANDVAIFAGLFIAVAGFLLQWLYQRRRDRREQQERDERHAEHLVRMRDLESGHVDANA